MSIKYVLAVDGGGARLSLHAVQQLLGGMDFYDTPNSKLTSQLSEEVGDNRTTIANWLRNAKACDYARFSPIVFSSQKQYPVGDSVLAKHAKDVSQLIERSCCSAQLPNIVIGGLVDVSVALLTTELISSQRRFIGCGNVSRHSVQRIN